MSVTPVSIDVLGPMEVRVHGNSVALGGPKQRAVLASLLLGHGRVVSMEQLVDVLWEEDPPPSAVTKVQGHVSALRKVLCDATTTSSHRGESIAIATRAPGYVLNTSAVTSDLARFDELTTAARCACDPALAADLLTAALALWRGAAFADVTAPGIRAAADRLSERRLRAIEDKASLDLQHGRSRLVLDELDVVVDENPFRDRLRELQIKALLSLDLPQEAAVRYGQWRSLLSRELGVEPARGLQQLAAAVGFAT